MYIIFAFAILKKYLVHYSNSEPEEVLKNHARMPKSTREKNVYNITQDKYLYGKLTRKQTIIIYTKKVNKLTGILQLVSPVYT